MQSRAHRNFCAVAGIKRRSGKVYAHFRWHKRRLGIARASVEANASSMVVFYTERLQRNSAYGDSVRRQGVLFTLLTTLLRQ